MKSTLLALLTAALLASCAPKQDETTTTTDTTTTTSTDAGTTDTASTDTTSTDTAATETGTDASDSTMSNDDSATTSEEVDMAAGDGLEGKVTTFDGTAQTFGLSENDKNYNVTVSETTTFEGGATTAEEFFGTDRKDASVAVEGAVEGDNLVASKITLN
ncbi:hypothetical protein LAJ19_04075 [Deinococcus taeanensis]|uniref:hypothetical protein n=1 Tax=Deinococcus taeanensis TaxID=2737050 RepID=UPI001CDCFEB8|nr:hypothetical protein [Deinococcus taeanensis]UBV43399.1 hypothetical protein LAJ19_04075 [Deinococcus taeanensis]